MRLLRSTPIHRTSSVRFSGRALWMVAAGLLAAIALPAAALAGKHNVKKDARRQIEEMEIQWRDAQLTANAAEMEKLLSDDYFGISVTGQVTTKEQQLERIRKQTLILSKIDLSDIRIKLLGGTAIVTSRAVVEGMNEGSPIQGTFRYTRVYQRTPAGLWRIANFEATRVTQPGIPPRPLSPPPARPPEGHP